MCGIVGIVGPLNRVETTIKLMADGVKTRGPDSFGVWYDLKSNVCLGHRRLSILDLTEAGNQPMSSYSGRFVIAFNGEIYNHLELRSELLASVGFDSWRGSSDTETVLQCFEFWGISKTLQKLVGMFAFSIFDKSKNQIHLIRDRFGEKPLYYGEFIIENTKVFAFASQIKPFRNIPNLSLSIDRNSLCLYFKYNNIPAPYSIFKEVSKLEPASHLIYNLNDNSFKIKKYWDVVDVSFNSKNEFAKIDDRDAIIHLKRLLLNTTNSQMLADVPVGAFLSGGVDSSLVVALMQAQSTKPINTYTIGFDDDRYDESRYAKAISNYLGTNHTDLYINQHDVFDVIQTIPTIYDEPFADASQIPTYLVSKLASQHVKVALSGDGGDELFGGYNRYQMATDIWPYVNRVPLTIRKIISKFLLSASTQTIDSIGKITNIDKKWQGIGDKTHKIARAIDCETLQALHDKLVTHWSLNTKLVLGDGSSDIIRINAEQYTKSMSGVDQMMMLDLINYLPNDILTKVDRAGMGCSLETRTPFLDHRVAQFSLGIPMEMKLRKTGRLSTSKWILRQILNEYVPKALIDRPKMGFGIPIDNWLRGPMKDWASQLLDPLRIKQEGYLNPTLVDNMWKQHLSGMADYQHQLWCVLMFEAWLEDFSVS